MTPTPGAVRAAALDRALEVLACPVCLLPLERRDGALACAAGHVHAVARQGYASLAPGTTVQGDPAAMVAARTGFLAGGWFDAVDEAVLATVPAAGWCVDLAGGPGHHLAAVLDGRPSLEGLGLDVSAAAARAAAGRHPRLASATADVRRRLPVRTGAAAHVLGLFGPRNGPETARVLAAGAAATIVTPLPAHLAELRERFGTLAVQEGKQDRADAAMAPLAPGSRDEVVVRRHLDAAAAAEAVLMGPSGFHLDAAAVRAQAEAAGPLTVTVAVAVTVYRHDGGAR